MSDVGRLASRRRTGGQSVAEFALIIPVFFLLLVILFDLGRVVYAQHTLNEIAREAGRVGSVAVGQVASDNAWVARYDEIRDAALSRCVLGDGSIPASCSWGGFILDKANVQGRAGDCPLPLPPDDAYGSGSCFYPDGFFSASLNPGVVFVEIATEIEFATPVISSMFGTPCTADPSKDCFRVVASSETQVNS